MIHLSDDDTSVRWWYICPMMIYLSDDLSVRWSICPMIYLSDDLSVRWSTCPMTSGSRRGEHKQSWNKSSKDPTKSGHDDRLWDYVCAHLCRKERQTPPQSIPPRRVHLFILVLRFPTWRLSQFHPTPRYWLQKGKQRSGTSRLTGPWLGHA